jgi:uncharacterized membrane protein
VKQEKINQREWENPANWSDSIVGVYFSKRDSRIWVPKRVPGFGWTLNLARPAGAWFLVALLSLPPMLAGFLARRDRGERSSARLLSDRRDRW